MSAFEILSSSFRPTSTTMNHVNNVVYLRWVQDVALGHWLARATDSLRAEYGWVATRHELDYKQAAVLGDTIVARTWIGTVDSRRFERLTEIVRTTDGVVLSARSHALVPCQPVDRTHYAHPQRVARLLSG